VKNPRPSLIGSAEISTFLESSSSCSPLLLFKVTNAGSCVSKFFAAFSLLSGGYLTAFLNSPSIVSPCEVTLTTLPFSTCWMKPLLPAVLLYGIVTLGFVPGEITAIST
jgi:hypothetical protein